MTFRTLLSGTWLLWFVLLGTTTILAGESQFFNLQTGLLGVGLTAVLWMATRLARPADLPMIGILTLFLSMNYIPRLASYAWFPDFLSFPFDPLLVHEVNYSFKIILCGILGSIVGILVFGRWFDKVRNTSVTQPAVQLRTVDARTFSAKVVWVVFILIFLLDLYIVYQLGVSPYGKRQESFWHPAIMALRTMVGVDTAFAFAFGLLLFRFWRSRRGLVSLLLLSILYLFTMTLGGSKAGSLRIFMVLISFAIVAFPVERIRMRSVAIVFGLLVIAGPLNFVFGSYFRTWFQERGQEIHRSEGSVSEVFERIYNDPLPNSGEPRFGDDKIISAIPPSGNKRLILKYVMPIANRLGEIDYSLYIISKTSERQRSSKFVDFAYVGKSLINWLTPGTPFDDAAVPTSRVLSILFRRGSEESSINSFNSEPMSLWAASYLYLGFSGGLIWIFIGSGVLNLGMRVAMSSPSELARLIGGFGLWAFGFTFYQFFGFDHLISLAVFLAIQVVVVLGLAIIIARFSDWKIWKHRSVNSMTVP